MKKVPEFYQKLSDADITHLREYLTNRFEQIPPKKRLSIVFDLLHECDLKCVGCGTNAVCVARPDHVLHFHSGPSLEQIRVVLQKCKSYALQNDMDIFVNFGGGEPFLRPDILDILEMSANMFGSDSVGIDTNATLDCSFERISAAMPFVSYIGISINGMHDYHNWWSGITAFDAFDRATDVIRKLCRNPSWSKKLEVTSVATKENLLDIPDLLAFLRELGVQQYSIHRAIPVGRMAVHQELIPSAADYLNLLLMLINQDTGIQAHTHHSIESIHAAILFGIDTYSGDTPGTPNRRSSLGINADCALVFDPWCVTGKWSQLTWGNLLEENDLDTLLQSRDSFFSLLPPYTSRSARCHGCIQPCSGGSRIVAATTALNGKKTSGIDVSTLGKALCAVDPACPYFES